MDETRSTRMRTDVLDPAVPPGATDGPAGAIGLGGGMRDRDSRRVAFALGALVVLAVVVLNVAIHQAAYRTLVRQRWEQLTTNTEIRRDQAAYLVTHLTSEARSVVEQPAVAAALRGLGSGAPPVWLERELQRSCRRFEFSQVRVYDARGRLRVGAPGSDPGVEGSFAALVRHALASPDTAVLDVWREGRDEQTLGIALPAWDASGRPVAVAVAAIHARELLSCVLTGWAGFGPSAGAYLVRKQGDQIQFLTAPPSGFDLRPGDRVAESSHSVRAAAMAVEGVESSIVLTDGARSQAVVTRFIPELQWGLVGQADRSELVAGMRVTDTSLLVFDLALVLLSVTGLWFWRRQYQSGLARREIEMTRKHADRVRAIVDNAFDAIVTFDRGGRIRSANRAATDLLGRTAEEVDGQPVHRFLQWGAAGRPGSELPPVGTVVRAEALRSDGTTHPVEFSLGLSGGMDDLLYAAIVRDITDRVEAEEKIEESARGLEVSNRRLEELNAQLEEASRLKSEFLANTSHELRTPLNGMIGFLQLVLDGMCDSPEEEREFQRQALECSRHLLGLINDVLDIAKIEAGKLTLEITPVDVGGVFDEVYTVTHVQAAQKGIKLVFEAPEDLEFRARGDFGKIKQILINLVGNSLKFTPKGSITVRAVPHPDLGHCMFQVQDTGIGIPLDRQKVIFEKFTQGDGSTTRKYGGTGLGLAITRSLVELMGGIIGVQSDGEGHGTCMYFSLPVWNDVGEDVTTGEEEHADRIAGPAGGPVVLLVEDDAVFRHYLTALLHGHGYRTLQAPNAEAGWVLARRMRPAVILLDYALSCAENANLRTGWDLAERLTSDAKTRHIPVIFLTGFEGELLERLRSTAFARQPVHLMKPVEGNVLVQRIAELVGSIEGRVIRLLMADDDPSVGAYIRKVLPEDRFHIELAANGEECLHVLRTQPRGFDLLLLDLMMPEVSGYDVLREMTLAGLAPNLPVLVLSNCTEPRNEEERRLLEEGLVLEVLPKSQVHENPQLLPHLINWHLQVGAEGRAPAATGTGPGGDEMQEAA
jgi:PAS domain S-box-containing protein